MLSGLKESNHTSPFIPLRQGISSLDDFHPQGEYRHSSTNTTYSQFLFLSDSSLDHKYNSQELDKESDLYYFNARHYDPELARFVSADTVVPEEDFSQSWNRYMYTRGNPITYKDPTGHIWAQVGRLAARAAATACSLSSGCASLASRVSRAVASTANKIAQSPTAKKVANFVSEKKDQAVKVAKNLYQGGKKLAQEGIKKLSQVADKVNTKTTEAAVKTQDKIGTGIDKAKEVGKFVGNQAKIESVKAGTGQGVVGTAAEIGKGLVPVPPENPKQALGAAANKFIEENK